MFAKITGNLIEKKPSFVVIDINGIGFEVLISGKTYEKLPNLNNVATLIIHTYIREDEIKLIGFLDVKDKEFFLKLVNVPGISIKIALSALSIYSVAELKKIIINKEVDLIRRIPGVGKKLAERIIIEIKDKIEDEQLIEKTIGFNFVENEKIFEIREALKTLGYTNFEINEVLKKLNIEDILEKKTEEILKLALKKI